jgi:Transposase
VSGARTPASANDPFHLIKLSTDALDEIRREVWNEARRQGQTQLAKELKGARFALWKNPGNLTERQQLKLARVQQLNQRLYRAYLLSQQLREIYRVPLADAIALLDAWLKWGRRSRLAPFVKLARTITEQRSGIEAAIRNRLSNARRGASQHPATANHPTSVRVPLTPRRDRTRDARTRRPLPTTTRSVTQPTVPAGGPNFRPASSAARSAASPSTGAAAGR